MRIAVTRTVRFILLAVAISLALPAVAAATADTAGRLTYITRDAPAPAGVQAARRAKCPAGTRVTGGGAYTSGETTADEVATSAPFDGRDHNRRPEDGWVGEVNTAPGSGETMTVMAICAPFAKLRYIRETAVVRPHRGRTAVAPCPAGTLPLGGGAYTTGSSTAIALRQTFPWERPGSVQGWDGWIATANNLTSRRRSVTAYGICKRITGEANYNQIGSFSDVSPLLRSDRDTFSGCSPELHASGGGAFIDAGLRGDLAGTLGEDRDDDDSAPDDFWHGWFNNESGTTEAAQGTALICVR